MDSVYLDSFHQLLLKCLRKQKYYFSHVRSDAKVPKSSDIFNSTLLEVCHPAYSLHGSANHQKRQSVNEWVNVYYVN